MKSRSQRDDERREKRNKVLVSLLLVFLMVFSTVGYFFSGGSDSTIRYNGHKIRPVADEQGVLQGYTTKVDGQELYFLTTPADTIGIQMPETFASELQSAQAIIFVFDPEDNNTALYDQLRFDFSNSIPKQQGAAITQASDVYRLPVAGCNETMPGYPFVMFREGERGMLYEDSCYVLQGEEPYDFALLRDRLVYRYHGITEE